MAVNDISINEADLTDIEELIFQELKTLQDPSSPLNQKLQQLKNKFYQYSEKSNTTYHQKSRFGFLEEIASSEYRILQENKIQRGKEEVIDEMYNLVIEITNEIMHRDGPLDYAIYFAKDGKVYRSKQNHIELDTVNISKSNHSLRISASIFKKRALEQKETIDITSHYSAFMKTLQDTYNGGTLPNQIVNAGIIAEAFERHLQNVHNGILSEGEKIDWSVDEVWRLIRQSKGNDPWYTGGDVGMTQVKNIGKGNVRLTQFSTVEDIVNFLLYLGKEQYDDKTLRRQAKETFKILYNEANDEMNDFANMTTKEIIETLLPKK